MTDITVSHDPDSEAATIEIRDAGAMGTRFRLRDPYTEKYLTKRGWTKAASFLPGEAASADGVVKIGIEADLARKITPGTRLSLEQPNADFQEIVTWPEPGAAITTTPDSLVEPAEEEPVEPTEAKGEPAPLLLDSFEPSIMHEDVHKDAATTNDPAATFAEAEDNAPPSTWKPAAIAAGLFFVLGLGLGTFWLGSDSAEIKDVRRTAAMQIEKQKWEFDRQLKEAKEEASSVTLDKTKTSAEIAALSDKSNKLAADRDAALKTIADKEKSVAALQKQLADADSQIEAVRNATGDKAKAQIEALDARIASLGAEVDKTSGDLAARDQALRDAQTKLADRENELKNMQSKLDDANTEIAAARQTAESQTATQNSEITDKINGLNEKIKQSEQQLAERDNALRDVQAKLSVANIQIDALKVVANKTTEAGLEKTAMSEKLTQLSAELDKTAQSLSDREQAFTDATAKLRDAETKLAAADKRNTLLAANAEQNTHQDQTRAVSGENTSALQEERDLYANELKTMTGNFSALQAEKSKLEQSVAELQSQLRNSNVTTSQIPSKAIWGATAIDSSGAVYSLQNQVGEKVALENVTAMCRGKSGSRCEALATYNNACFSLARFQGEGPSADNYAYFVHKDWKKASQTALERCQSMGPSCTVRFTACSPDALSKPVSE